MSLWWRRIFVSAGFAVGVAIVALLALIAYALLSDEGGGPAAQVAQPTETATPRPSPTATPRATPTAALPTVTPQPTEEPPPAPAVQEQPQPTQEEPASPTQEPPIPTEEPQPTLGGPPPATLEPASPTATATPPTATGHNGQLRLGDTATIGGVRVTVKSVTYGLSECKQLMDLSDPWRLSVPAGYEIICLEWDEDSAAVDMETPTATPGQRDEFRLVDSAGDEEEMGVAQLGVNEDGSVHFTALFGYRQGRRAVAFIYRNLWTGEEARWSLE